MGRNGRRVQRKRVISNINKFIRRTRRNTNGNDRGAKHVTDNGSVESKDGTNICKCCSKAFSTRSNRRRHEKLIDQENLKIQIDKFLSKTARSSARNMEDDLIKAAKSYLEFKCGICSKIFSSDCNRKRHKEDVHKLKRLFPCLEQDCGKRFSRKSNRDRHLLTHK